MHLSNVFRVFASAIAVTFIVATPGPSIAQPAASVGVAESDAALDAYLQGQLDDLKLPGISAAVVRNGAIEHLVALGEADNTGRPMTPQTPVHLASLSKGFTALAVMQLVEAGKVDLNAPVQRYLPWFRVADATASAQITVAQCLHHTSGIPHGADFKIRVRTEGITGPTAVTEGVKALSTVALRDSPGASFEYTNLGYNILGAIVEAVSGQPYAEYLAAHVFGPLHMTHAHTTIAQARQDGLAEGFTTLFSVYRQRQVSTPEALQPSATTFASAEDLAHEIQMYVAQGSYHGTRVIGTAAEKALHAATSSTGEASYTMGWWRRPQWELSTQPGDPIADSKVNSVLEHGGDWDNTVTYMGYVPATGTGLVVLINANSPAEHSKLWGVQTNAWRVLLGVPTVPVIAEEDFLQRFGWQIAAAVVLLELLVAGGAFWALHRRDRQGSRRIGRYRLWLLAPPLLLDIAVLYVAVVLVPARYDTEFIDIVTGRDSADVGWLMIAAVIVATVLAISRIILILRLAVKGRRPGSPPLQRTPPAMAE